MDKRGIISVEFILSSLIILLVIAGMVSLISGRMDAVSSTSELGRARMTAENVAEAINKVYSGGNGHSVTLTLPPISNKTYYINVNSTGVFILMDGMIGKSYINPKRITYSDKLIEANVWMRGNRDYLIKNKKDQYGNTWIVIREI